MVNRGAASEVPDAVDNTAVDVNTHETYQE